MNRFAPLILLALAAPCFAIDPGVSGIWYNPAQSGHGFAVTVLSPATASVAWYTYNRAGQPVWVSSLLSEISPGVLSGSAQVLFGMRFGDFNPATNQAFDWGTLRLTFTGCNSATVQYNGVFTYPDGSAFGAGTFPIQKLAGVSGLPCDASALDGKISGLYSGVARIGDSDTDEVFALLESNGAVTIMVPNEAVYVGAYIAQGSTASFTVTGQTVAPQVFANGSNTSQLSGTASYLPRDYLTGGLTGPGAGNGAFTLTYMAASRRQPSLGSLVGTYRDPTGTNTATFAITTTGTFTGTDPTGCTIAGNLTPKSDVYGYRVTATVTNCGPANGSFTGAAAGFDALSYGDARGLAVALQGPGTAFSVALRRD